MDINAFRSIVTVTLFVVFVGIVIWAYSKRRKKDFEEAAHLPFDDDEDNDGNQAAPMATSNKERES